MIRRDQRATGTSFKYTAGLLCVLGLAIAIGATGCASSQEPAEPEVTDEGLVMVRKTWRSNLWVKPDHHVGRYDNVMVGRIGFGYAKGQDRLAPEDEAAVGRMLEAVVVKLTEAGPVGIAKEPGPCVVTLNIGLRDLRLFNLQYADSTSSYVSSFGSTTLIMEFVDSTTDQILVRYVASRDLSGGSGKGKTGVDLKRLGRALGGMVRDMNSELQVVVPATTVRSETECNDGIYKLTGRG